MSIKTIIISSENYEDNLTIGEAWELAKDVLERERETLEKDYEDKLSPGGHKYTDYDCECDPNDDEYTCDRCADSSSDEDYVSNESNLTPDEKLEIARRIFERNGYKVQVV